VFVCRSPWRSLVSDASGQIYDTVIRPSLFACRCHGFVTRNLFLTSLFMQRHQYSSLVIMGIMGTSASQKLYRAWLSTGARPLYLTICSVCADWYGKGLNCISACRSACCIDLFCRPTSHRHAAACRSAVSLDRYYHKIFAVLHHESKKGTGAHCADQ